ncbi:MAG: hypothetical protein AAF656_12590 [Planctomycetota bacterium]
MRRHGFTFIDLLATLALCGLLLVTMAATQQRALETANRVKCASQLRHIGLALILYANDERNGAFPRTMYNHETANKPVFGTPYDDADLDPHRDATPFESRHLDDQLEQLVPEPNDVTAAFYMLLRTQDIPSANFVCPSSGLTPWNAEQQPGTWETTYTNFAGTDVLRAHLSYSYQSPYPIVEAVAKGFKFNNSMTADFAVVADMNPGGEALTELTVMSDNAAMRDGNSLNHAREGQNVLYADGHVTFELTPFVGIRRDNIFTTGDLTERNDPAIRANVATVGAPKDKFDTILLPTAEAIGQEVKEMTPEIAAEQFLEGMRSNRDEIILQAQRHRDEAREIREMIQVIGEHDDDVADALEDLAEAYEEAAEALEDFSEALRPD